MNTREQAAALHLCLNCSSTLVQPVEWEPHDTDSWSVLLRCPECEIYRAGLFAQADLNDFDRELDRGDALLERTYRLLVQENLEDEIDRFARALHADAILPEDF